MLQRCPLARQWYLRRPTMRGLLLLLPLLLLASVHAEIVTTNPLTLTGFTSFQSVEEGRPAPQQPVSAFQPDAQCRKLLNDIDASTLGIDTTDEFLYSRGYLPVSGDGDAYAADQQIVAPNDGLYTRFAFRVKANAAESFSSSYSGTFTMVNSEGGCTRAETTCPSDESCTELFTTTIDIDIANVTVPYRLQRLCYSPTSTVSAGGGSAPAKCPIPYSYLPIDDFSGTDAACSAYGALSCTAANQCMMSTAGSVCSETPCDDTNIAPAVGDPSADIAANCGALHDPLPTTDDLLFPGDLNQRCISACCAPCDAVVSPSYHQRWALGPHTYVYAIQQADRLLADLEVRVTVTNSFNGTVRTRTVRMLQQDLGAVKLDDETGEQVRVTINAASAQLYNALPDMTGGAILVWDYNDTDSRGLVNQAPDVFTNPYTSLPSEGLGMTPTENNLGLGFGWAYLNSTHRLGPAPGQYGASQAMVTSGGAQFGAEESCYNSYYQDASKLPGWDSVPANGSVGAVPRVETACQISHLLNQLTIDIVGGAPPTAWTGQWYIPPNYDFHRPNMWLMGDRLMVRLHDDAALFAALQNTGVGAGGARQTTGQGPRMFQLVEALVDVSEDLARYTGLAKQAAFGQTMGCIYDLVEAKGQLTVTVVNPNTEDLADFSITTTCQTSDPTLVTVTAVQPDVISTQVGVNSAKQLQPILVGLANTTASYDQQTAPDLSCFVTIALSTTPALIESSKTIECVNVGQVVRSSNASLSNYRRRNGTCPDGQTWGDSGCEETSYWIVWGALLAAAGFLTLAGIIALIIYSVGKSKSTDDDADGKE